jgi:hypothetical protein
MAVAADALDGSVPFSPWTAFCAMNPTIVSLCVADVLIQLSCYRNVRFVEPLPGVPEGQLLAGCFRPAAVCDLVLPKVNVRGRENPVRGRLELARLLRSG